MEKAYTHNTEVSAPGKLGDVRGVDLVRCPRCHCVVDISHITKPTQCVLEIEPGGILTDAKTVTIRGVWCPNVNCEQLLFDDETWVEHLLDRREWDREHGSTPGSGGSASLVPAAEAA